MFNWLTKKTSVDAATQLVIDDDRRRMKARRDYVRHEEALAYGDTSTPTRPLIMFSRPF